MMLIHQATHFLGAQLVQTLNQHNFRYLVAVDDELVSFPPAFIAINLQQRLTTDILESWLDENHAELEGIFHLDDRDTEQNERAFRLLWQAGIDHQIPFVFRATASRATWIEQQARTPFFWAGLSWDQAFGPGDEGWVPQAYAIRAEDRTPPATTAGEHHWVYSKDIAETCYRLIRHRKDAGLYSLEGIPSVTLEQLATWTQQARENPNRSPAESVVPPPPSLREIGLDAAFFGTEAAVYDYVQNYLQM